jgi:hypothetical protein
VSVQRVKERNVMRGEEANQRPLAEVIGAFERVASTYEAWFTSRLGQFVDAQERHAFQRILQGFEGGSVIDIGAGTGRREKCFYLSYSHSMLPPVSPAYGNPRKVLGDLRPARSGLSLVYRRV